MKIIADLHIHSKYSRATAKELDLDSLYIAAQIKGVQVLGTGDFSHPAWMAEIEAKLEPSEPGLFRCKTHISSALNGCVPVSCRGNVRFILSTEISNIYKKNGKTRKNHHLVLVPDLSAAQTLNRKLEKIGNIQSDGRPILGLDARDLLEVVLETSPDAYLIPAHIWTPWFSVLGSKSGFDSIGECFGDLADHIFAVETGLSSDPAMNWRVSFLDGLTLVSNSDAHSPTNIGREANLFDTDLSYFAIRDALKKPNSGGFNGTIEFFPEEGKYHMDGHRNCGVCLEPNQTAANQGVCPHCRKPLTIGVLNRVEELADRPLGGRPPRTHFYQNIIPLSDILSEILQTGSKSQRVSQAYRSAVERLGPELRILREIDLDDINRSGIPLLGEAIHRMREKKVEIHPGFDGEYGQIKIFTPQERVQIQGQRFLFSQGPNDDSQSIAEDIDVYGKKTFPAPSTNDSSAASELLRPGLPQSTLSEEQRRIVDYEGQRLLIVAGPGTGKTHALTQRIAAQIQQKGISANRVLAITFTNKAAAEMRSRLKLLLGEECLLPLVATFHGLCLELLAGDNPIGDPQIIDEEEQNFLVKKAAVLAAGNKKPAIPSINTLKTSIMLAKQNLLLPEDVCEQPESTLEKSYLADVYRAYQQLLEIQGLMDFEDLIFNVAKRLDAEPAFCSFCRQRFQHIYVDEYQDLNYSQYRIIRKLVTTGSEDNTLCVIGDPDQSIYRFRGSDSIYFRKFLNDYPDSKVLHLTRNYRSTNTILSASFQVINQDEENRIRTYSDIDGDRTISVIEGKNEDVEAEWIARTIERLIGGTGYHSFDTGRVSPASLSHGWGYSDFAVLTRTSDQLRTIADALKNVGVPFQLNDRNQVLKHREVAWVFSLLKILFQRGSYGDFQNIVEFLAPKMNRRVRETFTNWCLKNRLSLKEGFAAAVRFPIPGLNRNQQFELSALIRWIAAMEAQASELKGLDRLTHLIKHPSLAQWVAEEKTSEALNRLIEMVADSASGGESVFNRLAFCTDTDLYHPRAEKAALMTLHAAKGLEFAVVFIAGCEDGLIPFRRSMTCDGTEGDEAAQAEERRLFYVAMTRAKERLYLTWTKRRKVFGKTLNREKSPFVSLIENRLLQDESACSGNKKRKPDQLQLF